MKKIIGKSMVSLLTMLFISGMVGTNVKAEQSFISEEVPDEMQPKTIITYVDDTHYVINSGGIAESKTEINLTSELKEKIDIAKADGSYYTALHAKTIAPVKGLKVYYADDGFILKVEYPDDSMNPMLQEMISPNENLVQPSFREGPGPNDTLLFEWGSHKNQVWKIGNTKGRFAAGRATTFSDKYGQADNILKKGDAATSLAYDDCSYGTVLSVNAPKKNGGRLQRNLIKADKGGMPDAVLDIWKTGVEYWGYTWNEYLSIDSVTYVHG